MDHSLFEGKTIFLTGSSGFLGTALASKIVLTTSCTNLVLLCRGGVSRLHQVWEDILPPKVYSALRDDARIEVISGDICADNLGITQEDRTRLQERVNIVIHAASSINLRHNLSRLAPTIIQGTLNVADFALSCTALDRFVYISSAYANAYLHYLDPKRTTQVLERVHSLRDGSGVESDADTEWLCLQQHGTTPAFEANTFPWPYAYAKHLTERLLIKTFQESDGSTTSRSSCRDNSIEFMGKERLLIVRPSIIGPAEIFPAPGWQVASSAPVTGLLAFLILTPAKRLTFYSQFDNPDYDAIIDEVAVDIVVNRIIMHTFMGTAGVVHANNRLSGCYRFTEYIRASQKLRRLPWDTKFDWQQDPLSPKICPIARLYQVSGCTFDFEDSKSSSLRSILHETQQAMFPLFPTSTKQDGKKPDLVSRDEGFRILFAAYFRKRKWPAWMLPILYASP